MFGSFLGYHYRFWEQSTMQSCTCSFSRKKKKQGWSEKLRRAREQISKETLEAYTHYTDTQLDNIYLWKMVMVKSMRCVSGWMYVWIHIRCVFGLNRSRTCRNGVIFLRYYYQWARVVQPIHKHMQWVIETVEERMMQAKNLSHWDSVVSAMFKIRWAQVHRSLPHWMMKCDSHIKSNNQNRRTFRHELNTVLYNVYFVSWNERQ